MQPDGQRAIDLYIQWSEKGGGGGIGTHAGGEVRMREDNAIRLRHM